MLSIFTGTVFLFSTGSGIAEPNINPGTKGYVFGEIFLRILVLEFFLLIKLAPETIKARKKLVIFFIPIFYVPVK
jgi:hypothetical protein